MNDVELITKLKKNMKPKIIAVFAKILLRKRSNLLPLLCCE
jgi:hypothetical protein